MIVPALPEETGLLEGCVLYEPAYGDLIVIGFYDHWLGCSLLFSEKRIAVGVEKLCSA